MNKTDIEWCTRSWNPITGCEHGCDYCFACGIASRFVGGGLDKFGHKLVDRSIEELKSIHDINIPEYKRTKAGKLLQAAYPYGFEPTYHRYRLNEPAEEKIGQNVFVVDMGDLFGEWVPESWIREILTQCAASPQHNYLFLTKNPARYSALSAAGKLPILSNFWFGSTVTHQAPDQKFWCNSSRHTFLSIEPLLGPYDNLQLIRATRLIDWVIVGAETGQGSEQHRPQREWVKSILRQCRGAGVPIFMKNNLSEVMGGELVQEMPLDIERVAMMNTHRDVAD
jgi:protein gp37